MTTDFRKIVRMAVVQDVLDTLDERNIKIGKYCSSKNSSFRLPENGNAQKFLPELEENCQICALGSCLLSFIKKFNNVSTDFFLRYQSDDVSIMASRRHQIIKVLDCFDKEQLDLIELAFEIPDEDSNLLYVCEHENSEDAVEFGRQYENPKDRLEAIMLNIKENDGIFIP